MPVWCEAEQSLAPGIDQGVVDVQYSRVVETVEVKGLLETDAWLEAIRVERFPEQDAGFQVQFQAIQLLIELGN